MKKTLSLALVLALVLTCVAAVAVAEIKTGLGIVTSIASSRDAAEVDGEVTDGRAQVDSTICAVTLEDGVIVSISFDVAQTRVAFSGEGVITADKAAEVKSKKELGDDYGMRGVSGISKEVGEQITSFEEYCVGKTPEEVLGMATYQRDENHTAVPDIEELKSSVTITVGDYLAALEKAVANAK